MELLNSQSNYKAKGITLKAEVLRCLEFKVKELISAHVLKRKLWFSSDFIPTEERMDEEQGLTKSKLRDRAKGIGDQVKVALAVNLLTEEGLPHFHSLLTKYLGDNSFWAKWTNMWTAEEDRHGNAIRDYEETVIFLSSKKLN